MMQVKDQSGNIVPGLLKDSLGSIIVEKDYDYNKYVQEKKRLDKINNLESEVKELIGIWVEHVLDVEIEKTSYFLPTNPLRNI